VIQTFYFILWWARCYYCGGLDATTDALSEINMCIYGLYRTESTWSPTSRSHSFLKLVSTGREDFLGRTGSKEDFLGRSDPSKNFLGRAGPKEHFLGRLPASLPSSNSPIILRHVSTKTFRKNLCLREYFLRCRVSGPWCLECVRMCPGVPGVSVPWDLAVSVTSLTLAELCTHVLTPRRSAAD
jgi:hypothetical protein